MARPLLSKSCRTEIRQAAMVGVALGLAFLATGCLHRHPRPKPVSRRFPTPARASPRPTPVVQGEEGIASWYGHPYHGRQAASGETYNMYDLTAAHRTLPFDTQVRVHNLENGRDVVVRINDRGPFVEGRIIDLSYAAAQDIGMPGTALVRLEILGFASGPAPPPGVFAVQVGAFKDRNNAERLKARLASRFGPVTIQGFDRGDGYFYRVRVGSENTEDAAQELARHLRQANLATAMFVVRLN